MNIYYRKTHKNIAINLKKDQIRYNSKSKEGTFKENFKEFLLSSSLHGLKYTANSELSILERIFFISSFILVILLSGYFINNVYLKWRASPIIISTSPTPTYTSTIPFPAITICSLNQARKSRVEKIKKNTLNYTLLWSLCARDLNFENDFPSVLGTWHFFRNILLEVSQPCDKMVLFCQFGGKNEKCNNLFNPLLTDDGLCCTFNAVDPIFMFNNYSIDNNLETDEKSDYVAVDWTPEKGYESNLPEKFYPRIAQGTGKAMGLTVILNVSAEEYFCSASHGIGFKVLVHSPAEQPKISNYGFFIQPGEESRVSIQPTSGIAAASIRTIDKRIRHCLFSDEGNLKYFRWYSRKNCELECEADILGRECGCVLYYLPRISSDIPICGPKDNNCTQRIQNEIASANTNLTCEICYPACFELSFSPQISTIRISENIFASRDDYPEQIFNKSTEDISIVHFYYESNFFRSQTKDEIIGFTEFLSNTGGLLGLFMGFSIFSLIEIIYFMSLKPYCTYKKHKNTYQPSLLRRIPHMLRSAIMMNNKRKKLFNCQNKKKAKIFNNKYLNKLKIHSRDSVFPYYE